MRYKHLGMWCRGCSPGGAEHFGDFNLSFQPIGVSDLIGLSVSDSPELSRSVPGRYAEEFEPATATGTDIGRLMPDVLGDEMAAALKKTTRLRPLFPIRNSGERSLALSLSEV
jgi:hypothetical protein